jgi:hypothetical protein
MRCVDEIFNTNLFNICHQRLKISAKLVRQTNTYWTSNKTNPTSPFWETRPCPKCPRAMPQMSASHAPTVRLPCPKCPHAMPQTSGSNKNGHLGHVPQMSVFLPQMSTLFHAPNVRWRKCPGFVYCILRSSACGTHSLCTTSAVTHACFCN